MYAVGSLLLNADSSQETPRVQSIKRRVESALRPGAHGRTNQFDVSRQLDGLQEKFQVLHRDELAEALHERLAELGDYHSTWLTEMLSLLLQLSDRPAQNARVEDLQNPTTAPAEAESLEWDDINPQGTAFSAEDIWEEVDFAASSSDDGLQPIDNEESPPRTASQTPITPEQEYVIPNEVFTSEDEDEPIASTKTAPENHQSIIRGEGVSSETLTELQFIREVIFMLHGLPTSIFWRIDNNIEVDRRYKLSHSSNEALSSLLHSFTNIGVKIDALRQYTQVRQTIPYMQTFCRGIEEHLLEFDGLLSTMQAQYFSPGSTVSLLRLLHDIRQNSRHLELLSELVSKLNEASTVHATFCIDLLYDSVCMLEAIGDDSASRVLATLFFSCFKTYTRPIRLWMETGQLDPSDSPFFVRASKDPGELRTLWHEWYVLDQGNKRNIPHFLETGVHKVFTAGKSVVFLRHLNALPENMETLGVSEMTLDDMCPRKSSLSFPFSAMVESAFEKMVEANHSVSAGLLRTELDEQCGLWVSLDALHHVYLSKDLSLLGIVDTKVFELMDRGRSWDDKFLVTEFVRSAFSAIPTMDLSRLVVRSDGSSSRHPQNRTVRTLETISIDYVLPWPIANIITQGDIQAYRRIATFLMQIRRAKYAIVKQRISGGRNSESGDMNDTLARALQHNLLWFLDVLYSHLTYLVITTTDQSFRSALSNARDVDAMIAAHQSYMSSLQDQCLLVENLSPIHEAIISLLDLSVHFADLQAAHANELASEDGRSDDNSGGIDTPRRARKTEDDSDSDEEDMDHDQTLTISFRDASYDHHMRNVKSQFDHLILFVADGLKGVARAGGLPSWNILADRLEWRKA